MSSLTPHESPHIITVSITVASSLSCTEPPDSLEAAKQLLGTSLPLDTLP